METRWGGAEVWRVRSRALLEKPWARVAAAVAALFLLAVVLVPLFVNADTFRPAIENKISSALGRRVSLGHLSFSLLSGSLVADNVAIADDPAFSSAPFFQAKSLHIGVSTLALLFGHRLQITNFTANAPQIHLISNAGGKWNYASLGGSGGGGNSQSASDSGVRIGELKIESGAVDVSSVPATGAPFVYNHVNLTVRHLSYTTPMPFDLTADLPAGGSVKLSGTAGPIAQPDVIETPLQAAIEVKNLNLVAAGVVPPADGVSMVAGLNANLKSDGKTMTMTGKLQAAQLKLSPTGSPAPQPVDVDLDTTENIGQRTGQIADMAIHTGNMAAHVTGTYQMTGQAVMLNLHLSAPGLPVDGLEQLLPAVGIKLPSGSSLHGGTLTANLAITGPASAPDTSGPVEIDNTQLAGFALASKIEGLRSSGGGSPSGTQIHTLRATIANTPQSTDLSQIYCDVPGIGTATGSGTVSAAGALNFQLTANLSSGEGQAGVANAAMSALGGLTHAIAPKGVPLTVTGTTADPKIRANLGAMLKQNTGGLLGKGSSTKSGILGAAQGLFKK